MKTKLLMLSVISLFFLISKSHSQDCTINNPIVISSANMNENYIIQKVLDNKSSVYTSDEIDKLNLQISSCQAEVTAEINKLNSKFASYSESKQKLIKINDFKAQDSLLGVLKKNRKSIENTLNTNLSQLSYRGLFLVILKNTEWLTDDTVYANKAKRLMGPVAIDNIMGMFIKSLIDETDNQEMKDIIKSYVSGSFSAEDALISTKRNSEKIFIYLAKVKVEPQKNDIDLSNSNKVFKASGSDFTVIDVLSQDYESVLTSFGVSVDAISSIKAKVENQKKKIIYFSRHLPTCRPSCRVRTAP